jgi:cell division protein FtsW
MLRKKQSALFRDKSLKTHYEPKRKVDYGLLVSVILLTLFGLVMVYDSSVVQAFQDFGDKYYYIKQQLIWVVLGLGGLGFFSILDYHFLKKIALPFFIGAVLLLIFASLPGLGVAGGGAHRWLRVGPATIQPAEIIKLASIIYFATLFEKGKGLLTFLGSLFLITFIIGFLQKDLGSTVVFFATSVITFIMAGAPLFYFVVSIPVAVLGAVGFIATSEYRRQRIAAFFNPFADPKGYSYHISQVLIALGSGNWFGVGLGQSRQKFQYIPEVTTDSIFAIVGEEFGFFGAVILIGLISFLIYRCFKIADRATDDFGRFLGYGLTLWLGIQAALNLAAMVSLVPLTGVPLPFISYGGSALLANLVAIGILLNISRTAKV